MRRSPIKPVSKERRDARRERDKLYESVLRRDRWTCQFRGSELECKGRLDPHHIVPRGRGGKDLAGNLITLCRAHHDWVHSHPEEATVKGLLASPPAGT